MGFDPRAEVERQRNMPSFKQFVEDKYIPFIQVHKRSWDMDKKLIDNRIMPLWGQMKISEISRDDVQEFQANLLRVGQKNSSVNRYMALVKYIFNLAERWEIIDKCPARNVSKLEDNNHKKRYLSSEETERLLAELKKCRSQVVPDIIEFLILTGARKSEVVNMPWAELDLVKGTWTIPPERNKAKTRKVIPLSLATLNLLERRKGNDSEYVFPSPKTGMPYRHFHNTWDRIRKKAGIPDVRIHDLRHNFASLLINSGRSLYEVQKLLGHASISTTQRYAHLTQDTLRDATEVVSLLLGSDIDPFKVRPNGASLWAP
jgi:integrase